MKKKLFIIALLAIGMAAGFGSCKKKTVEPTSDPEPTTVEEDLTCKHDSLVHVYALEPTGEENGCIEHYACAYCGATFADASATIPVENTILWATNYAFDNENIIEKDFARWAGDEPYLLRALRGNLCGECYEGTIVNDYSGWEDWTEAQWQAYWEKMSEYYIECGGEGEFNVVTNPAQGVASIFINKVINKKDVRSIDENIGAFFSGDDDDEVHWEQVNAKLDTIMKQLDDIQNSINALTEMIKVDRWRLVMQQRYEKLVGLMNLTYDYFNPILRLIAAEGKVGYDHLSAATKEKIKNLTEAWHNTPVGGTTPELELMNMLQYISGNPITNKILPQIYDSIAKHDAVWEHQGNAFREMARGGDVVLVAECYLMNLMYYETHREETFADSTGKLTFLHQNTLNLMMMDYANVLNSNPIEYHDYYVCQIPGAKIKLKKHTRQLKLYELIEGDEEYRDLCGYRINLMAMDKLGIGIVVQSWFSTVYQYYKSKEPSSTSKTFLYDKLIEVGYKELSSGTLIAYDGFRYSPDAYMLSINRRCAFVFTTNWLGYRTCVNNNDGSIYECKVIENMRIARYGLSGAYIYDLGQKVTPERTWLGFEVVK